MKIVSLSILKVEIPMISSFATSFGTITKKPTVIVRLKTNDGTAGWGESAALPFPNYKSETTDTCMLALHKYIGPLVLNEEFNTIEELTRLYRSVKGYNFAKTGLETAAWMIFSLQSHMAVAQLLGGTRENIPVGESVGIKPTIKETLEEIALRLSQKFQRIKIKIQPGWDIGVIEAVRNKFGDIPLMVDANSAYTLDDKKTLKKFDNYNLMMIEQPLADDDIVDHSILQKMLKTPICLDESILSAEDARRAIFIGACKIINIKPGRVGGLLESKKIHDLCQKHGIGVWCGGLLESGIGRGFNIALASLPNFIYPADMSPASFYFSDDLVIKSFAIDNKGRIDVPHRIGLGYDIDEEKVARYTTDKIEVK